MDTTENIEKVDQVDVADEGPKRFSLLVLMASVLSLGSLAWSTWSLIDLYQVDVLTIEKLGGVSLIALSAAVTMDLVWSATTIAEYQGQKIPFAWTGKKGRVRKINMLPVIGWVEVLFVAGLVGYHGSTVGGGAATFAAVLPVFTKLTWMLALNGLKDPNELTDEEKAGIAAQKRKSRLTREQAAATAEQHAADMVKKEREHEAILADRRRENAVKREDTLAEIERKKLEKQAEFDLDKADLEGQNEIKAMRQRLNAQLQITSMRTQQEITLERLTAEQDIRMMTPIGVHVISGQTVQRPQLSKGPEEDESEDGGAALAGLGLTVAERRRLALALKFYAADAAEGGITKSAFAKSLGTGAPRITEATTAFPVQWFAENDLSDVLEKAIEEHRALLNGN